MVLEPGNGNLGENPEQYMTDLNDIRSAAGHWWTWFWWLPKSRRVTLELAQRITEKPASGGVDVSVLNDLEAKLANEVANSSRIPGLERSLEKAILERQDALDEAHKLTIERDMLKGHADALQSEVDLAHKAHADLASLQEWCKEVEDSERHARKDKNDADARVVVLEAELKETRAKLAKAPAVSHNGKGDAELLKLVRDKDDAIFHLVRWIRTTHRAGKMPEPKTIKELLFNAQQSHKG